MPLTPNRKIDRKHLPVPGAVAVAVPVAPVSANVAPAANAAPTEDLAAAVNALWAETLGVPQIGPRDNFFALGGHSLLAIQLHRTMRDRLALPRLGVTDIFRFPVMADFVKHVAGLAPAAVPQAVASAPTVPAAAPVAPVPAGDAGDDAMARRRALRAQLRGGR